MALVRPERTCLGLAAPAALAAACSLEVDDGDTSYACPGGGPCPSGYTCVADRCVIDLGGDPDAPPPGDPDAPPPGDPDAGPDGPPPATCGDGTLDPGEECDAGVLSPTGSCVPGCVFARCDDGLQRAGVEECDDGDAVGGDGCSAICTSCGEASLPYPSQLSPGDGHCDVYVADAQTYRDARDACADAGAYLVTLTSAVEEAFVRAPVAGSGVDAWIGLDDIASEGAFRWVTNEPFVYDNFVFDEPNGSGDGVRYDDANDGWRDTDTGDLLASVCEVDPWALRPVDNHAYRVFRVDRIEADAALACQALGATLASIDDAAEASFAAALVHQPVWVAGPVGGGCQRLRPDGSLQQVSCVASMPALCEVD
jgi:cysteine-rich repeat protein